jgi:hypothetical protein
LMRMDFELKSSLKVLAEIKKTVLYQWVLIIIC